MIQYLIAAGIGALVGSAQRKGKKFAMGGTTGDAEERAFAEYIEDYGVDREEANEQFIGEFDSKGDWAAEFVDDIGGMESLIDPERFYRIDKQGFRAFALEEASERALDIDEDNAKEYAKKFDLEIEYEEAVEEDLHSRSGALRDFITRLQEEEEEAVLEDFMTYTTAEQIINDLGPNYGMGLDNLEDAYLIMPDYNEVADALEDDGYVFIEKDFKTFVFNSNMARGGKTQGTTDEAMRHKHVGKVAERSIKKMDSDDQLSSLREYAQHDIGQKFAERDKALKKAYEDKATFDLPTPRYYTSEFAHGGIAHTDSLHQEIRDFLMSQGMNPKNYAILEGDRRLTKPFEWVDLHSGKSRGGFATEADALQALKKFLQERYGLLTSMAHGGKTHRQGYDDKLDESLAMRRGAGRTKQQSRKDRRDESAGMERSMGRRKYASVGTMDKGRRKMAHGGQTDDLGNPTDPSVLKEMEVFIENEMPKLDEDRYFTYGMKRKEAKRRFYEKHGYGAYGMDLFAHGGMHGQGYDDKLDESLAMRKGAGRTKQQSRKDRRDESAGMEKSMGRRKYASVGTMDKGSREMKKGGVITAPQPILDGKEFIALVVDKDGMPQMKFSKTFNGAMRMAKNMMKKFGTGEYSVKKFEPYYGASFFEEGLFIEPTKSFDKGGKTKKRKEVSDFDKLAMKVAARYRAEGKSNEEAMEIGRGTAAKVYRQQQRKKGK